MEVGDLVEYDGALWEIMFIGEMQLQLRHLITDEPRAAFFFDVEPMYPSGSIGAVGELLDAERKRLLNTLDDASPNVIH